MNTEQADKMRNGKGFIAALDQSGGSTPKALAAYGVGPERYSNDAEMFDLVHAMRTRVITSKSFTSERIIGAILFERTMDGRIEGRPTAEYLWEVKHVVPFLKVDKGLAACHQVARKKVTQAYKSSLKVGPSPLMQKATALIPTGRSALVVVA